MIVSNMWVGVDDELVIKTTKKVPRNLNIRFGFTDNCDQNLQGALLYGIDEDLLNLLFLVVHEIDVSSSVQRERQNGRESILLKKSKKVCTVKRHLLFEDEVMCLRDDKIMMRFDKVAFQ